MSKRPGIGANYIQTHKNYHVEALRYYTRQNGIYARLPRLFKDQIFSREQRRTMAEAAEFESTINYRQALVELAAFHPEPVAYYAERRLFEHDQMTRRINSKDKF